MQMRLKLLVFFVAMAVIAAFPSQSTAKPRGRAQTIRVTATEKGYRPRMLKLKANVPARITFIRRSEKTCATEVIIPEFNIKQDLPLNKPVVVKFTPTKVGNYKFVCAMDMMGGLLVVR